MSDEHLITVTPNPQPQLTMEITDDVTMLKIMLKEMATVLQNSPTKSRARSLAITHMDTARLWLHEAFMEE